jgi:deazaflavin-dependent oxidoreductase (nitroreductase family)
LKRLLEWLGRRRWIPAVAAPVDRLAYRLMGRGLAIGIPTLILHHVGRRSGQIHKSPLFYITDGDSFVSVATNYGRREPQWSLNLRTHPDVTLEVGRKVGPYRASSADSAKSEEYWQRFIAMYENYEGYRRSANRNIPVWVFSPR